MEVSALISRHRLRKPIILVVKRMMHLTGVYRRRPYLSIIPDGYIRHNVVHGRHQYVRWNSLKGRWDDVTEQYLVKIGYLKYL